MLLQSQRKYKFPFFAIKDMLIPKIITSAVFNKNGDILTGDNNGTIYLWLRNSLHIDHAIKSAHASSISTMCMTDNGILLSSCMKQCLLKEWDPNMKLVKDDFEVRYQLYSCCCSMINFIIKTFSLLLNTQKFSNGC